MPTRTLLAILAAAITCTLAALPARAQDDTTAPQPAAETTPPAPSDPYDRLTPRSSMTALLRAYESGDLKAASNYIDLRFLPWHFTGATGEELADQLDFVLERRLWIDPGSLSDEPEGDLADTLPKSREKLGDIKMNGETVTLYLQRVRSEEDLQVWKISSVSIASISDLYQQLDYPPIVHWFENNIPDGRFLGLEYFKWVLFIGSMLLAYPFAYLLGVIVGRACTRKDSPIRPKVVRFFKIPVAVFIVFLIGRSVVLNLGLSVEAQRIGRSHTLIIVVVTWVILAAINVAREVVTARLKKQERLAATALLRPASTSIKFIIIITALLMWLDNVGYDISTLLAGLGIGGLAIALALQKPMEDFFGAITLFTQQPVRVHDFCKFGSIVGVVEEIGLRSSRIRTLDNTMITVPNARIANEFIENISLRAHIRFKAELRLAFDTKPSQIRQILTEARELLAACEKIDREKARCRFKLMGPQGLIVEVLAKVQTTDYAEYLEVAEQLNLGITEIVERAGVRFAIPLPTLGAA